MKSLLKWILIIITILIFLYAFSDSYGSQNIDNLDYVVSIGIDLVPDSNNLEISFEFADLSSFSEDSSSSDSKPIIDTVIAPTLSYAIDAMNAYVGKQMNLSHCKIVIFSEEIAKKGIVEIVSDLTNNTQVRPTVNIIISKGQAKKYIENSQSSLEKITTKYYDVFPTSSEYTGYTSNITLDEFYEDLINENIGAISILGKISESKKNDEESYSDSSDNSSKDSKKSSSNESMQNQISKQDLQNITPENSIVNEDRGTENIGLCIFKDDKYIGDLSSSETLCYCLIKNEVDNFVLTLENPKDSSKNVDLAIDSLSTCNINIDTSNDNPKINIKVNLTAKALNGQELLDYSSTETLNKLNESLKNYLQKEFLNFLNKTSQEYKTDINDFYTIAKRNFLTNSDLRKYDWKSKYENAEFNVEIDSRVVSSLLIQNS